MKTVKYTNKLPECPVCKKYTERSLGSSITTLAHFEPIYDENGVNINPDKNMDTYGYKCHNCNEDYFIKGNVFEGYKYI